MYKQLAAGVCFASALTGLCAQRNSAMKLELILPRDVYLTGEQINVDIQLTNTGTAAVDAPTLASSENPQPVYHLRGPSYPAGVTFSFRDLKPRTAGSPDPAPSIHHLNPSASMATGFDLNSIKPVSEPGDYTLGARIDWGGWSAEAVPVPFHLARATFVEASLGVDVFSRSTRTLRAVWIAESENGRQLGETFLYEKRPDLGEVTVTGTRIIRAIGPTASNPFCPWVNYDRVEASKFWHGWQEGATLVAFSDDEKEPRTFDMGSSKAQIVQPTFMRRSGELDVLVLGENRRTLRLVRFAPAEGKPVAAWSIELPEDVSAIHMGISPQAEGGNLVAAAVSKSGTTIAVRLIRIGDNSAEVSTPAHFDNAHLLPNSEPSVNIAPDGSVQAAVLFAKDPALRTLAVGEVTANGTATQVAITDAGLVEAPVLQAWTAYRVTPDGPPARVWLIRTGKGSFGGRDHPIPVASEAPIIGLLQMSGAAYALSLTPTHGPRLIATEF